MDDFAEAILAQIKEEILPVSNLIQRLRSEGYENNFTLYRNKWLCTQTKKCYASQEIRVDEIHRLQDDKNMLQGIFIYAVSDVWHGVKGILIIDVNELYYSSIYA
ncbi:MAG: hypothetical protein JNM57_10715 [Cyclobacteriaceae bacterium]|nr:hypothetical protein [Cyclobacteriaceae bacterium]